ncbi:hypothetical protein F5884DRAFT_212319 [Xylogone sp. PMI_703]|nr:hypothetical protein F5884DRAFT_212319 [Xylogone sp. PMI_703]
MTSAITVGSTGLVGSHILSTLLTRSSVNSIHAIARRQPATTDAKLHPIVSTDTASWANSLSSITPTPDIFFSSLGTTAAAAGGTDNQRKLDLDVNLELAKAARDAGVKVYVLISTGGANPHSSTAYFRIRGELEERVKELGFEKTVILRPGILLGPRNEWRPLESVAQNVIKLVGLASHGLRNRMGQDAEVVARAAVNAGTMALEGKAETNGKVWMLLGADIVRLGKE